jgi:NitT/TauT family transport system ATP-binding protein
LQNLTLSLCREQDLTLVIVTHAIEEAAGLGKKILLLGDAPNHSGRVFENLGAGQNGYRSTPAYYELCDRLWKEMHYEPA